MCKENLKDIFLNNVYFYQMFEGLTDKEKKELIDALYEQKYISEEIMDYLLSPVCRKKDVYYYQMIEGIEYDITDEKKRELVRELYRKGDIDEDEMVYSLGPTIHGTETIRKGNDGSILVDLYFQNGKIVNEMFVGIDVGEAVKLKSEIDSII